MNSNGPAERGVYDYEWIPHGSEADGRYVQIFTAVVVSAYTSDQFQKDQNFLVINP
jgi:hypothetical protein